MTPNSRPPDSAPTTAARPAPPRPRRGRRFVRLLVGLAVIAAIGAAAHATFPVWWPKLDSRLEKMGIDLDGVRDPKLAGLVDRIRILEEMAFTRQKPDPLRDLEEERAKLGRDTGAMMARLEALENAVASARRMADATAIEQPGPAGVETSQAVKALAERLQKIEGHLQEEMAANQPDALKNLEKSRAVLSEAVAEMDRRVAALESGRANPDLQAAPQGPAALLIALGRLREAVRNGQPYLEYLEAVKATAQPTPHLTEAVAVLEPHGAVGVPSMETLRRRFDDMAAVVARPAVAPAGEGWMDRTMSNLSSLVTIRRSGSGSPGEAQFSAARAAVAHDDLAGAIKALDGLEDRVREAAAPWVAEARARFTVEEALGVLHNNAVALVAGSGG